MLGRCLVHGEGLLKGLAFDCRRCGQCVLRSTRLICPMRCPKGLRNGPCGGTLDGRCEVHPERDCIWVRIDRRRHGERLVTPPILPSPDPTLFDTPSILNLLSGRDHEARQPLPPLTGATRSPQQQTRSRLEAVLRSGRFVHTTEIRAPRSASLQSVHRQAQLLAPHVDALNATAFLGGLPSLPSGTVAAALAESGIDAIAQATCRDHTKTSLVGELFQLQLVGVSNLLCLTGDSFRGRRGMKQVFAMDASLMLYEARHLREHGRIHCTESAVASPPRLFLGAAINPFTSPREVPLRRLLQKADAGADFVQTQLVADPERFAGFMHDYVELGLDRRLFLLAGIPLITSRRALEVLPTVPGIHLPAPLVHRLQSAADIAAEGLIVAQELLAAVRAMPGVAGAHLMCFGPDHDALIELARTRPHHQEQPCPSPASPSSANASIPASPVPSA